MVVWFHSFPLTGTSNGVEFFTRISQGQTTAGALGVFVFFVISGFLITMSFDRSKNVARFLKARVLRIFPGFIVVILLTVFIVGPLITTFSMKDYFTHPLTRQYLLNITLKSMHYNLPGVFAENIYPNAVNGSIWTLWYEFFFYLVVAILGSLKLLKKEISLVLYAGCFLILALGIEHLYYYIYFGLYFFAGMIFYLWKDKIQLNGKLALVAVGILILGIYTKQLTLALSIGGTYLIFYLSLGPVPKFPNFSKHGDLSYGIYIYSFVVQQVLQLVTHNSLTQMQNFLYTLPIVFVCAFFSWHFIEKKCMQLKNKTLIRLKREEGLQE